MAIASVSGSEVVDLGEKLWGLSGGGGVSPGKPIARVLSPLRVELGFSFASNGLRRGVSASVSLYGWPRCLRDLGRGNKHLKCSDIAVVLKPHTVMLEFRL